MFLTFTALYFAKESAAKIPKAAHIFHPTTNCELIRDIQAANAAGGGPNIVDLGGNVFELTTDCASQAGICALPPAACYANGSTYAQGPNGLPEINTSMLLLNGRIVRSNAQNTRPHP